MTINICNFVENSVSFSEKIRTVEKKVTCMFNVPPQVQTESMYLGSYIKSYVHQGE